MCCDSAKMGANEIIRDSAKMGANENEQRLGKGEEKSLEFQVLVIFAIFCRHQGTEAGY